MESRAYAPVIALRGNIVARLNPIVKRAAVAENVPCVSCFCFLFALMRTGESGKVSSWHLMRFVCNQISAAGRRAAFAS